MTSVGRKLDNSINCAGGGPYTFRLYGELIHRAGFLLPSDGDPPIYAQLYIYNSEVVLNHCLLNQHNFNLHPDTLRVL